MQFRLSISLLWNIRVIKFNMKIELVSHRVVLWDASAPYMRFDAISHAILQQSHLINPRNIAGAFLCGYFIWQHLMNTLCIHFCFGRPVNRIHIQPKYVSKSIHTICRSIKLRDFDDSRHIF
jgi:hypothetical protein